MNCNCKDLDKVEKALPTRKEFIKNFNKIDSFSWKELFICNYCDQVWIVEDGAELSRRANFAFKINDKRNWLNVDIDSLIEKELNL